MMALVIAHAHMTHLPSTLCFAEDYMDESCGQKSDVVHILSMAWRAIGLVEHFNPNSRITLCRLESNSVPEALRGRVSDAEYKELLQPLREFLSETNTSPGLPSVCFIFGLLLFPIGIPLMWSAMKQLNSLELKVQRRITTFVNQINALLASRGISLDNHYPFHCQETRSNKKQRDYIMWVVHSL